MFSICHLPGVLSLSIGAISFDIMARNIWARSSLAVTVQSSGLFKLLRIKLLLKYGKGDNSLFLL